ncbi:MAG: dihydroorotase family protein [Clostridiales Family XIII bacterium]|jgi:dihydroorotase-like cyclic amidohydrolase|nr:dihydroorotase family protein [Clostridiales Family XIII bacterium]
MYDLFIKNGIIYTEAGFQRANIGVKGEKIALLTTADQDFEAEKVIDAEGMYIFPGFIDPHTHLRDPGFTYKEDFFTGSCAFAHSGYTMVCPQPNLDPVPLTLETYKQQVEIGQTKSVLDFNPPGCPIGDDPDAVDRMSEYGSAWFKFFQKVAPYPYDTSAGTVDSYRILQAFKKVAKTGKYCTVHPFDQYFYEAAIENCKKAGLPLLMGNIRPNTYTEEEMTSAAYQLSYLAKKAGMKWYALHCWHSDYIDLVRMLKKQGEPVVASFEYMPSVNASEYIYSKELQKDIFCSYDNKPNLPKIWEAVRDGTIDWIGSDHAPHSPHKDYDNTNYRFSAGFALGDYFGHILVSHANEGDYSYEKLAEITSVNFAKTMGFYPRKGSNCIDTDADFTIVDMREVWNISKDDTVYTKTQTIPYVGRKLHGKVKYTVLRGRVLMENDAVNCEPGYGKFVKPLDELV